MIAPWFLIASVIVLAGAALYIGAVGYFLALDGVRERRYGSATLGTAVLATAVTIAFIAAQLLYNELLA
jgi:hypothetical protein